MPDFEPNLEPSPLPKIPLPQGWMNLAILALLHVIALAPQVSTQVRIELA